MEDKKVHRIPEERGRNGTEPAAGSPENVRKADSCCFTGHRNIRKSSEDDIRAAVRKQVLSLLEEGVTTFYVGGAMGFDMLAAEVLLDLRDREGAEIRIVSALPFPDWRSKWPEDEKKRQDLIMEKSDHVFYTAEEYSRKVFLDRDRKMVDESGHCIAYCTRLRGGTAYTVRYAMKKGLRVCNIADWDLSLLAGKH